MASQYCTSKRTIYMCIVTYGLEWVKMRFFVLYFTGRSLPMSQHGPNLQAIGKVKEGT